VSRAVRTEPSAPSPSISQNGERAAELFRSRFEEVSRSLNDPDRCDLNAAVTLAERGYDRRTIEHAIRASSPTSRSAGAVTSTITFTGRPRPPSAITPACWNASARDPIGTTAGNER
jgi:hypothetical protein